MPVTDKFGMFLGMEFLKILFAGHSVDIPNCATAQRIQSNLEK